jgi:hypothetical protein
VCGGSHITLERAIALCRADQIRRVVQHLEHFEGVFYFRIGSVLGG